MNYDITYLESLELGAKIAVKLVSMLGSRENAEEWLTSYNNDLSGIPGQMIQKGDICSVYAYLMTQCM